MLTERDCRVCHAELETVLDLGDLHSSGFLAAGERPLPAMPFDLCLCSACRLVQLRHTIDPDLVFRNYWYASGVNEAMRAELAHIVDCAVPASHKLPGSIVIDIGANDGTLLSNYGRNLYRIAFEPALNLNEALHEYATVVVPDYFPRGLTELEPLDHKVHVITSIACFYDLDDPAVFVEAIKKLLRHNGVWIVQFQDWHQMQQATAFDNICTEHLIYYSLASFERLIAPYGLQVFDAELRPINGGSYRLHVGHVNGAWKVQPTVDALRHFEAGCEDWETFNRFAWRCEETRKQIQATLSIATKLGIVDVYGASTKFNTLAQWCDIDHTLVRWAWERSPAKVGLRTAGTNIPIVSELIGRADPPEALLVGIWQFRDSVLRREADYLAKGGRLILPLPKVEIVRHG